MKVCISCMIAKPSKEYNVGKNTCRSCQKRDWLAWRSIPENVVKTLVNNARRRALKSGLEFDITYKDLLLPEVCPVLKIPIVPGEKTTPNSPSIDRLDPDRGYTPDNVVIISHLANRIKSNATPAQIRLVADWLDAIIQFRENPGDINELRILTGK